MKKNKIIVWSNTKEGYRVKTWQNIKTGEVTPTNWKVAAGWRVK